MKLPERFWNKVDKNGPVPAHRPELGPCHVWTGSKNHGYGRWQVNGRTIYVHVSAYEAEVGEVEDGKELDHLCRVRACCRPSHLEEVTHQENIKRGNSNYNKWKTHCSNGHLFNEQNTQIRQSGGYTKRTCRSCKRRNARG